MPLSLIAFLFISDVNAQTFEECYEQNKANTHGELTLTKKESKAYWNSSSAIIQAFKLNDSSGLISLIDETTTSPRVQDIKGKKLSDLYPEDYISGIGNELPVCSNFNSDGAMLYNGNVWFHGDVLTVIHGLRDNFSFGEQQSNDYSLKNNILIRPECIQHEWSSSDNVEAVAEIFGVDYEGVSNSPASFIKKGREGLFCPWSDKKESGGCIVGSAVGLMLPMGYCRADELEVDKEALLNKGVIKLKRHDEYIINTDYKVLGYLDNAVCQSEIGDQSYKVEYCFVTDMSSYRDRDYGIHSIISDHQGSEYIVPIKWSFGSNKSRLKTFIENKRNKH